MGRLEAAKALYELYACRTDTYALQYSHKQYAPARLDERDLPFTADVCSQHLQGKISIGCYPLDREDQVQWVAVDYDGKRGNALQEAVALKTELARKLGLISWLERSQSGVGIHVWLYFTAKIPAAKVRVVIGRLIPEYAVPTERRTTAYDRMFPNQDSAYGSYGNLCALPLNGPDLVQTGKTVYIDDTGTPYPQQSQLLLDILAKRNSTATVLAAEIPAVVKRQLPVITRQVPGGTKLMCDAGCAWLRRAYKQGSTLSEPEWYAALGQFARVEGGATLAHKFSANYPDYSQIETQKKFDHARQAPALKCSTVWAQFGHCGRDCSPMGVTSPWQLAQVPLVVLQDQRKPTVHNAIDLADTADTIIAESVAGKKVGYAWGYDLLDNYTELRPRNLVVVASRTGLGKTSVLIDVTILGAQRGVPQYVYSLEMGYEELALRYAARLTELDHTLVATGRLTQDEHVAVKKALTALKDLPIYIDDATRDPDRMLDSTGGLLATHGTGVVWVDYLQLVRKQGRESQKDAVDRVVDAYKQMAKILDVPVVTLAQLSRSEELSESSDDLDSWLKDSGNIEQTADVIHYLRGKRGLGTVDRKWRLHKERHRSSGVNLRFLFHQSTFKFEPVGLWEAVE